MALVIATSAKPTTTTQEDSHARGSRGQMNQLGISVYSETCISIFSHLQGRDIGLDDEAGSYSSLIHASG